MEMVTFSARSDICDFKSKKRLINKKPTGARLHLVALLQLDTLHIYQMCWQKCDLLFIIKIKIHWHNGTTHLISFTYW